MVDGKKRGFFQTTRASLVTGWEVSQLLMVSVDIKSTQNSQAVKKAWRRQHKFVWIVVINNFGIILPSQLLLGHHLVFHNFFHAVFFVI